MKVNLSDIIEAIESREESLTQYYNKNDETIIYVVDSQESNYKAEDILSIDRYEEWEQEIIKQLNDLKENTYNYIKLPTYTEINESRIMISFSESLEDKELSRKFIDYIHKNNVFHEFRSFIEKNGLINEWYDFQEVYERKLAIKWCEDNNIEYV